MLSTNAWQSHVIQAGASPFQMRAHLIALCGIKSLRRATIEQTFTLK